jgi:hypothetical protein
MFFGFVSIDFQIRYARAPMNGVPGNNIPLKHAVPGNWRWYGIFYRTSGAGKTGVKAFLAGKKYGSRRGLFRILFPLLV